MLMAYSLSLNPDQKVDAVISARDRLLLLASLLDPEDYQFVEAQNPAIAKRFRSQRMQIFRAELWRIASNVGSTFRARASRIEAAGFWQAYLSLVHRTASTCYALSKLRFACMLFSWGLPVIVDVRTTTGLLFRCATAEAVFVAPPHSLA